MKTRLLITMCFFLLKNMSFAQCDVNIIGNDFAWCTPCDGTAFANVTGGTAPYNYSWSTSDTTAFINNLCAGTYFVEITDGVGCVVTDSVTINPIGTPMTLNMTSTAPSCPACCDICLNPNPIGGCAPYFFLWSPSDPNWPSPCVACPFLTYTVTVTDACGCSLTDSLTTDSVTVGTTEIQTILKSEITIFPNPGTGLFNVSLINGTQLGTSNTLEIYTLRGQRILQQQMNENQTVLDLSTQPAGIYMLRLQNTFGTKTIKLVKQ